MRMQKKHVRTHRHADAGRAWHTHKRRYRKSMCTHTDKQMQESYTYKMLVNNLEAEHILHLWEVCLFSVALPVWVVRDGRGWK